MGAGSATRPRALALRVLSSTDVRLAAALCAGAFVRRLALVLEVRRRGFVFNDTLFYHSTAQSLAEGRGFRAIDRGPTAQWPPGFPFLLSLVYRVTGAHERAGLVMNAALGALTVPLLYALARDLFGRREAVFAGTALAVLPGQILWTDVLLAEVLYTFLLVGFFLMLARLPVGGWSAAVLGLGVGALTLTRGEGLLLIPAVLAAWWRGPPRLVVARRGLVLVGCTLVAIVPWAVRNAVEMHAFIPLSTNSSTTLWSGHNPRAIGVQNYAPHSLLARINPNPPHREIEEGRLLRREAFKYMVHHPARELELIPLKL